MSRCAAFDNNCVSENDVMPTYLVVFRELSQNPEWSVPLPFAPERSLNVQILAGDGECRTTGSQLTVNLPRPLSYMLARLNWAAE